MPEAFDVFLSHTSQDKPVVRQIGSWLEAREISVWLDEWELRPGFPLQEGLEEGISASRAGAVFVGPGGLGSWQIPEMRAFIARSRREKIPVIPVLLPGCPDSHELTLFLEAFIWVDLRAGVTDEGLQRLAWGINGTKPVRRVGPNLRRGASEPLTPLLLHPPETPAFFAGRDLELGQIEKALTSKLPCVVVVLGMGGQGKTTLVAQWVRTREPMPFEALFWCTAYRGGFSFDTFLDAALDYLEHGEFDKRSCPEPSARVERLLRRLQER
ncbi:MAG TPA: toll/interleukin-1 receptor domain-containing protein, partial [Thermoanaerobaculia bacterium]|nr:toll/interleukin-1 receptor domain-containing protein [Thermoanaerobaculia bacterium]